MELNVKKLDKSAIIPKYAHFGDAGCDLSAIEDVEIGPNETKLVRTGIAIELPLGFEAQIRPRSGLALKNGITVLNTPGTIDCFTGDMKISTPHGEYTIDNINITDLVLSMNIDGDIEADEITNIIDKGIMNTLLIETNDGIIEISENTEVFTKSGIKLAKNLTTSDEIININLQNCE
jgi:dUTP pyrophosphatase